jgi:hypothetical protein
VSFGYRHDEISALMKVKSSSDVRLSDLAAKTERDNWRPPVAVSLGCHLKGALEPHADPNDPNTLIAGYLARMGKEMPVRSSEFLTRLKNFVVNWIKINNIPKLNWDHDTSFETWLSKTHYPLWRKDELRKYESKIINMLERNQHGKLIRFVIKLFMKDEHYVDFKHARGIYARDDAAKITFGPWFKAIEEVIYEFEDEYKSKPFIKHVPVRDRPKYMFERLFMDGAKYIATDYSSFEAHFTKEIMEACEFVLYEHMLSGVCGGEEILDLMKEVLTGTNKIYNRFVDGLFGTCEARRMSGEMNTSLGNGFSNLMFMSFICHEMGLEARGVVEGDDGLFSFVGKHPQTEDFAKYGFLIKLDAYDQINKASFCGNLFDENDMNIITDPYDVFATFGWTTNRYINASTRKHKMLLRSKALSLAYQYPGCPLIGKLAQYALRMTRSFWTVSQHIEHRRDISLWERDQILEAVSFSKGKKDLELYVEPGNSTRLLFEELYNIPISTQLIVEEYLDSLTELQELNIPLLSEFAPDSWQTYFCEFTRTYEKQVPPHELLDIRLII